MFSTPPPLTARVRCGGRLHRVQWDGRRVRFPDHAPGDLRFLKAFGTPGCRCVEICRWLRDRTQWNHLPPALRLALEGRLRTRQAQHHGRTWAQRPDWPHLRSGIRQQAVGERFEGLCQSLAGQGLRVTIRAHPAHLLRQHGTPWIGLFAGSEGQTYEGHHVLGAYGPHGWRVDWLAVGRCIQSASGAVSFWQGMGRRCVPCRRLQDPPGQQYPAGPPDDPHSFAGHVASRAHWERIAGLLAQALAVDPAPWTALAAPAEASPPCPR